MAHCYVMHYISNKVGIFNTLGAVINVIQIISRLGKFGKCTNVVSTMIARHFVRT